MLLDEYDYETDIQAQREERQEKKDDRRKKCSPKKLEKGKTILEIER